MRTSRRQTPVRRNRAHPRAATQWAKHRLKVLAARRGYLIERLDDESRRYVTVSHNDEVPLPPGAAETLRRDNPDLLALEAAYDALDVPATTHTQWRRSFLDTNLSMAWFRGDNAYVWQYRLLRSAANIKMYLQLLDVESRDRLGLLKTVSEDGLFGAFRFTFGDRAPVSRDVLDSVNEINYLDVQMGLSRIENLRVLDIGAGYGRLAHRMSEALPDLEVYDCTDGVATSTFLCDYYTRFRGLARVRTVPLHQHATLAGSYDLCVNIHSWSECSYDAVCWWLDRVAERDIEWLLIVPNTPPELLTTESDGSQRSYRQEVLDRGYEQVDDRPAHENDELRELIEQHGRFHLFRRTPR